MRTILHSGDGLIDEVDFFPSSKAVTQKDIVTFSGILVHVNLMEDKTLFWGYGGKKWYHEQSWLPNLEIFVFSQLVNQPFLVDNGFIEAINLFYFLLPHMNVGTFGDFLKGFEVIHVRDDYLVY